MPWTYLQSKLLMAASRVAFQHLAVDSQSQNTSSQSVIVWNRMFLWLKRFSYRVAHPSRSVTSGYRKMNTTNLTRLYGIFHKLWEKPDVEAWPWRKWRTKLKIEHKPTLVKHCDCVARVEMGVALPVCIINIYVKSFSLLVCVITANICFSYTKRVTWLITWRAWPLNFQSIQCVSKCVCVCVWYFICKFFLLYRY